MLLSFFFRCRGWRKCLPRGPCPSWKMFRQVRIRSEFRFELCSNSGSNCSLPEWGALEYPGNDDGEEDEPAAEGVDHQALVEEPGVLKWDKIRGQIRSNIGLNLPEGRPKFGQNCAKMWATFFQISLALSPMFSTTRLPLSSSVYVLRKGQAY